MPDPMIAVLVSFVALVAVGGVFILFRRSPHPRTPTEVTISAEDGFADLNFEIESTQDGIDGTTRVIARGLLHEVAVGFELDVLPGWKKQKIEDSGITLYFGKVCYRSVGGESDAFVRELGRLYGFPEQTGPMASCVEVSAVVLGGNPSNLASEPVHLKAFLCEDGDEDRYAEVFTNIDLKKKVLEFHEKSTEYRLALLMALQGIAYSPGEPEQAG